MSGGEAYLHFIKGSIDIIERELQEKAQRWVFKASCFMVMAEEAKKKRAWSLNHTNINGGKNYLHCIKGSIDFIELEKEVGVFGERQNHTSNTFYSLFEEGKCLLLSLHG